MLYGSDLFQVMNQDEEDFVLTILASRKDYAQPVMPGIYHLGLHQRQSGGQYYHRNGVRV